MEKLERLNSCDSPSIAIWAAIEIDNYLAGRNYDFSKSREIAKVIKEEELAPDEITLLSTAVSRSYKKNEMYVPKLIATAREIASKLESLPDVSRTEMKRLRHFCIDLSKVIGNYRAFYDGRSFLSA